MSEAGQAGGLMRMKIVIVVTHYEITMYVRDALGLIGFEIEREYWVKQSMVDRLFRPREYRYVFECKKPARQEAHP
jgi:hypothetical protein